MITKEQYLAAIEIITEYHNQVNQLITESSETIEDFIKANKDEMSVRLYTALKRCATLTDYYDNPVPIIYVKDLTERKFLRFLRNAGRKTWNEYQSLINKNK